MDALTGRLGTRIMVVTVMPTAVLASYVAFLLAAGAPIDRPSWSRAIATFDGLTTRQLVALLLALLVASIATHPLQVPLVQLVEGYWWGLPFGPIAADRATQRFRKERRRVRDEMQRVQALSRPWDWTTTQAAADARYKMDMLPRESELLPTALGNALRAGETRAGARYGLEMGLALPRLFPLLSPRTLTELRDRRNQLDAVVRLCVVFGVATVVGIGLLLPHGPWLVLPVATYLMCWACYLASIAAARGFCKSLAAAVDSHHLQLFDALQLERPANLAEEVDRHDVLRKLWRGEQLDDEERAGLRYTPPKANQTAPEWRGAATDRQT